MRKGVGNPWLCLGGPAGSCDTIPYNGYALVVHSYHVSLALVSLLLVRDLCGHCDLV